MNRIAALLAGAAFSAAATSAIAADPTFDYTPVYDWTGAYLGAQIGYGWGDANLNYVGTSTSFSSHDPSGFLGGIYVGYNHQLQNNVVLGIDADITWSGVDSGFRPLLAPTQTALDVDYTAALRARIGYAADRWLPYIAGGLAVSRATFIYDMLISDADIKDTLVGWTLGAGIEYAATDNFILRAEYRYSDFGNGKANAFVGFPNDQAQYDFRSSEIRFGVAYKF